MISDDQSLIWQQKCTYSEEGDFQSNNRSIEALFGTQALFFSHGSGGMGIEISHKIQNRSTLTNLN